MQEQKAVTTLGVQTVQQLEADKLAMRTEINNNMQKHAQEMSLLKGKLEVRSQLTMMSSACCTVLLSLGTDASISKACNSYTVVLLGMLTLGHDPMWK